MSLDGDLAVALEEGLAVARRLFAVIGEETTRADGVRRESYGTGEQRACEIIAAEARSAGLGVESDPFGNLYLARPSVPWDRPAVVVGSHLDSVPAGGNFDGLAGVLGGLACLWALRRMERSLPVDIRVMGTRGEENAWFGAQHIGSRLALGTFPPALLVQAKRFDTGRNLASHMAEIGLDVEAIRQGAPYLSRQRVRAFVELHIEQGPVLDAAEVPVGIVTGIRGNVRTPRLACLGDYAHSGATPRQLRKDAVLAMVELIARTERSWLDLEEKGHDLVITFGQIATDPAAHSITKVPGEVGASFEARSHSPRTLAIVQENLRQAMEEIARRRSVRFTAEPFTGAAPSEMNPALRKRLAAGCAELGIPALEIASGAGHDAGDFADAGIPAAMIFVRNQHGSHNPREAMRWEDFALATRLLLWTLLRLD